MKRRNFGLFALAELFEQATQLRRLLAQGEAAQNMPLDLGHPLLAAWGRLGQHFGLVLNEGESGVLSEVRDYQDYAEQAESSARLHRLQQSLRLLDPAAMTEPGLGAGPAGG